MPRYIKHELTSWGNFPRQEVLDFRPDTQADLRPILQQQAAPNYISRGLGKSYGDAALNAAGGVIRHERLNRFLAWDEGLDTVTCEAGVTYDDLLRVFLPRGYFPPVTPGTRLVTLGGAIAADVHGKNHHRDGSLASFLDEFELMTANGDILTCSRTQHPEIFWATLGGMGLTGVILSARLRLQQVETAYLNVQYQKAHNLDEALEAFADHKTCRYSVAWIDCLAKNDKLGRSVLMRGEHATVGELPPRLQSQPLQAKAKRKKGVPFHFPGFALNRFSVRMFNRLYYFRHVNGEKLVDYDSFFYPLDSIHNWNRIYGKRGFVQYQVVLPTDSSRAGLIALLEKLSQAGMASFLAVLKLFGPGNDGLLSFPFEGATLALDLPNKGERLWQLLQELDQIVLQHNGRVYLAKDARLSQQAFEAMYPRAGEFRDVKQRVDPEHLFSSSLSRRIGLTNSK